MNIFLIFILGVCIGSFLNVCIYRIPKEESIVLNSSHCMTCGAKLKVYDLIPLLSYLFLRGRCRKCNSKISFVYPAVELGMGIVFMGLYLKYGITLEFFKECTIICLLTVIALIDINTKYIYMSTIYFGLISGAIFFVGECVKLGKISWQYILGFIIGYLIIKLIVSLTNSMGNGDIDIAILCGLFFGIKGVLAILMMAFILGAIIGIYLILIKKKDKKYQMAFGPYIMIASIIFSLYGNSIISWYMKMFV